MPKQPYRLQKRLAVPVQADGMAAPLPVPMLPNSLSTTASRSSNAMSGRERYDRSHHPESRVMASMPIDSYTFRFLINKTANKEKK